MANEITVQVGIQLDNGELRDRVVLESDLITQTIQWVLRDVLSIPTTAGGTVIATTGLTTPGYCYVKNLESAGGNYIELGPTSGGAIIPFGKLKAGEQMLMRLAAGISLRALANTGAVKILIVIYDD